MDFVYVNYLLKGSLLRMETSQWSWSIFAKV
jgi:hypothetical protein